MDEIIIDTILIRIPIDFEYLWLKNPSKEPKNILMGNIIAHRLNVTDKPSRNTFLYWYNISQILITLSHKVY